MSEYDNELIDKLKVLEMNSIIVEFGMADKYFELLNERFPVSGTKIDWNGIRSKCKKSGEYMKQEDFTYFINSIKESCLDWGKDAEYIIYIGDSLTENAYKLFFTDLTDFYKLISQVPQHHYFLNQNAEWCLCLDTSNYLDFSFAPGVF